MTCVCPGRVTYMFSRKCCMMPGAAFPSTSDTLEYDHRGRLIGFGGGPVSPMARAVSGNR